ncbi:anti-anti-sigma factor [Actinoplanes tereljensis]
MDQEGPDPNFSATVAVADGRATVTVTGEVDMSTADAMIRAARTQGASAATLDLREVTFFDSAAIHAVLQLVESYGEALTVLPSSQVRRVLEISGLAEQPWLSE